jgi:hypothetical protein
MTGHQLYRLHDRFQEQGRASLLALKPEKVNLLAFKHRINCDQPGNTNACVVMLCILTADKATDVQKQTQRRRSHGGKDKGV